MIVITGGAGFIGSSMLWELNRLGRDDILVVDNLGSTTTGKWKNLAGLSFDDFIHKDAFLPLLESHRIPDITAVIHMGAISTTTEADANLLVENNFGYSQKLALFCASRNIRFIYASSAATYGDGSAGYSDSIETIRSCRPLNMYGYSKHLFDLWAKKKGLLQKSAGLKFFNVYGPNEYHKGAMSSMVFKAFHQIRQHGRVELFVSHRSDFQDGEQLRDFVYIKDCTAIMLWLLDNPSINGLFNIGTGKARSFNDLVTAAFRALDIEPSIRYIPMPEALRNQYQYFTQAETKKLESCGYTKPFTSLEEGISDYVCNYLERKNPYFDNEIQ